MVNLRSSESRVVASFDHLVGAAKQRDREGERCCTTSRPPRTCRSLSRRLPSSLGLRDSCPARPCQRTRTTRWRPAANFQTAASLRTPPENPHGRDVDFLAMQADAAPARTVIQDPGGTDRTNSDLVPVAVRDY